MGMTIYDLGLVRRLGVQPQKKEDSVPHRFLIQAVFPSFGPCAVTWKDEEGVNYVASVNVRMELDPEYDDIVNLSQERRVAENSISEVVGQEDESEEWV